MYLIILFGLFAGIVIFVFTFILSRRNGAFHLASLYTFYAALAVLLFGLFVVGGFEAIGYILLSACILVIAILGKLAMPLFKSRFAAKKQFSRPDITALILLPILLFGVIGAAIYFQDNSWVIDRGTMTLSMAEADGLPPGTFEVVTISEGAKEVYIKLDKTYDGQIISLDHILMFGSTKITLKTEKTGSPGEIPYVKIGLPKIKEPLQVQLKNGEILEQYKR